ncbi:amidase [Neisseria sp. S1]|uniref:amidase n=1 Tax=Neisseria sp. S1 TaxID=3318354 RepID=UPI003A8B6AE6
MQFEEYRRYDAIGLAELVRRGEVSADELLQTALARLDSVNPSLNLLAQDWRGKAYAWQCADSNTPLAGVPFLLKDLMADWQGVPTLSGNPLMKQRIPQADSHLTAAYQCAGLRIFGKTTTPEWGLLPYTESAIYGVTRNPWDTERTPGGSSGGSAAAVAAGIVPVAHGGDGGGSIRLPAHNCGLFGLKPSRGRVDSGPLIREAWQGMVCEHVLTRSVRDSALMLDIAAQTQHHSIYACPPAQSFSDGIKQPLRRLKIAYWRKPWLGGEVEAAVGQAFEYSLKLLADAGHNLEEAAPDFADAEQLGRAMLIVLAGELAHLQLQLAQQLGRKISYQDMEPSTWALMTYGKQLSAAEAYWARDLLLAQAVAAERFHRDYDVQVTPVCPRLTPFVGELAPSESEQRISSLLLGKLGLGRLLKNNPLIERESRKALAYVGFTVPFNMSGQPAMSVPLYWHEDHLPVGTQFAAAHGQEQLLLQLAAELESINPWAQRVPPL